MWKNIRAAAVRLSSLPVGALVWHSVTVMKVDLPEYGIKFRAQHDRRCRESDFNPQKHRLEILQILVG